MKALCLDLGTSCGGCLVDTEAGILDAWVWDLAAHGKDIARKADLFSRHLTAVIDRHAPELIAVEEPFSAGDGYKASRLLDGLLVFAQVIALRRGIPCRLVHPSDVKHAAGLPVWQMSQVKGQRTRVYSTGPDVLVAMRAKHPDLELRSPDAAIAVAIGDMLRAEARGTGAPSGLHLPQALRRARGRRKAAPARTLPIGP